MRRFLVYFSAYWLRLDRCIAKAIDRYVGARSKEEANGEKIDPKLQGIIEGLLRRCISEGEYKQASAMLHRRFNVLIMVTGHWHCS